MLEPQNITHPITKNLYPLTNIYFLQHLGPGNRNYIVFFQEFLFCFVLTSKKYHILYAFLTYFTLQVNPCK